jgi:hypothetical protein
MNEQFKKLMEKVKAALASNDPAIAIMGAIGELLASMQEAVDGLTGKIGSIQEAAASLRIVRIRNDILILILGIVLGAAGTGYWMNGHGYVGGLRQEGVKVFTAENNDHVQITVKGFNIDTYEYTKDEKGNIIGFRASYWRVHHAKGSQP